MVELSSDYIAVGRISGIYGNQGWVKVVTYSGIPDRFKNTKVLYFSTDTGFEGKILAGKKIIAQQVLLKFSEVNNRELARELIGSEIFVPEKEKVTLPDNHFFIHDLIGLNVLDTDGNHLGKIDDVLMMGTYDVYVVKGSREILIPAAEEFISKVDIESGRIIVRLWDGM